MNENFNKRLQDAKGRSADAWKAVMLTEGESGTAGLTLTYSWLSGAA